MEKRAASFRTEHDSMGEVQVPADKYWGAQTQRSRENFPIGAGKENMPEEIIHAFGILKKAAAMANHALKPEKMTEEKLSAISKAADEVAAGKLQGLFDLVHVSCHIVHFFVLLIFSEFFTHVGNNLLNYTFGRRSPRRNAYLIILLKSFQV